MISSGRGCSRRRWKEKTKIIFEDIAEIMSRAPARAVSRRMGLDRKKVQRMARGLPFVLDYNTVFALNRLGYEIEVVEKPPEFIKK